MTANGPAVFVTLDAERSVALVRGREAESAVYAVSPADFAWAPEWSRSARGWVVPLAAVDDISAWGQARGELVVMHQRREPP